MLCENCNAKEATVRFTETVGGRQTEHFLCNECAAKLGQNGYAIGFGNEFPFVKFLTGIFAAGHNMYAETENPEGYAKCPKCNMSFEEFTHVGKFGCSECYRVFGPLIGDNMRKIHGSSHHRGKKYMYNGETIAKNSQECAGNVSGDINSQISDLEMKLKEAIMVENYEAACKYRDELKALRQGNV